MHVLLLPSWYPAAADDVNGSFFRLQAQALHEAGAQVGVVVPQFRSLRGETASLWRGRYGRKIYTEAGIPTYTAHSMLFFPHIPYLDRLRWLSAGEALFTRYIKQHGRPDVLHAHCVANGGLLAQRIRRRYGIPYVITEHSSTYERGLVKNWQRPQMASAVADAARLWAVSNSFGNLLEQFYPGSRWQYLPNMLPPLFAAEPPPRVPRQDGATVFCSVGALQPHKGFDLLLSALAAGRQAGENWYLHLVGGGPCAAALQEQAAALGLTDAVRFWGAQTPDTVRSVMAQSDIFVSASRVETFGVVLIEALSQGLPIVAADNSGPRSIWNPQRGLLATNGSATALYGAMYSLAQQKNSYPPQHLRASCLAEFGAPAIAGRLLAAYREVAV